MRQAITAAVLSIGLISGAHASSTGVVQLSSVTAGPVCNKFNLNGEVWAISANDFNAGARLSLIEARALAGLPVKVSVPSESSPYGDTGPDEIGCGVVVGGGKAVKFPNAYLIQ